MKNHRGSTWDKRGTVEKMAVLVFSGGASGDAGEVDDRDVTRRGHPCPALCCVLLAPTLPSHLHLLPLLSFSLFPFPSLSLAFLTGLFCASNGKQSK